MTTTRTVADADPTPTSTVVTAAEGRRFIPGFEGIRAVAAIMVVYYHVGVYTGQVGSTLFEQPGSWLFGGMILKAQVGLPVFFVLSGALLYRPFAMSTITGSRMPATLPYLWRRALRILPAYWAMMIAALLVFNRDAIDGLWQVVRPLLLLHVYETGALPVGMGQTWSLSTEVVFYLLIPVFALGFGWLARNGRSPAARARRILLPLMALILLSTGYTVLTHLPFMGEYPIAYLWMPEYACFLALGMALATMSVCRQAGVPVWTPYRLMADRPALAWSLAVGVYVLACTPIGAPQTIDYPGVGPALVVKGLYLAFTLLLIAPLTALDAKSRVVDTILGNRVTQYLGRISYGIFLWHLFFLEGYFLWSGTPHGLGNFPVVLSLVLAASIAAASLSFYLVEKPIMRLRPWLGKAPPRQGVPVVPAAAKQPAS
jgi:peptidoglycan/LPS O-acetylase OafA/YrhL